MIITQREIAQMDLHRRVVAITGLLPEGSLTSSMEGLQLLRLTIATAPEHVQQGIRARFQELHLPGWHLPPFQASDDRLSRDLMCLRSMSCFERFTENLIAPMTVVDMRWPAVLIGFDADWLWHLARRKVTRTMGIAERDIGFTAHIAKGFAKLIGACPIAHRSRPE